MTATVSVMSLHSQEARGWILVQTDGGVFTDRFMSTPPLTHKAELLTDGLSG